MVYIYVKYSTGIDGAPNNGSLALPYKTINYAKGLMGVTDFIAMLEDEPITAQIDLTTLVGTSYAGQWGIIGVNASTGLPDGTKRKIYGNGVLNYAFKTGVQYCFNLLNIWLDNFTEYAFQQVGNYLYRPTLRNIKLSNCKGLTNNVTLGWSSATLQDIEITSCGGGNLLAPGSGAFLDRIFIYNCAFTTYCILAIGGVLINSILHDISSSTASATNVYVGTLENVILDLFNLTGGTQNIILYAPLAVKNVLVTRITFNVAAVTRAIINVPSTASYIDGVSYFGLTNHNKLILTNASGSYQRSQRLYSLSALPYADADSHDFRLIAIYPYRRTPLKIGEFNDISTFGNGGDSE